MTDYRIEAATKEEWAERALRAEAALTTIMAAVTEWAQARKQVEMGQVSTWERLLNAESALAAINETKND